MQEFIPIIEQMPEFIPNLEVPIPDFIEVEPQISAIKDKKPNKKKAINDKR